MFIWLTGGRFISLASERPSSWQLISICLRWRRKSDDWHGARRETARITKWVALCLTLSERCTDTRGCTREARQIDITTGINYTAFKLSFPLKDSSLLTRGGLVLKIVKSWQGVNRRANLNSSFSWFQVKPKWYLGCVPRNIDKYLILKVFGCQNADIFLFWLSKVYNYFCPWHMRFLIFLYRFLKTQRLHQWVQFGEVECKNILAPTQLLTF